MPEHDPGFGRSRSAGSQCDRLSLLGMEFYGHHGVEPTEQELGQNWEIDLDLYMDLETASVSDQLADAVDYAAVYGQVHQVVVEHRYRLVEALAGAIVTAILQHFPVAGVRVRVRKICPPVGGVTRAAEVELVRWRRAMAQRATKPRDLSPGEAGGHNG